MLTLFMLSVIIIPSGLVVNSLYEGVNHFSEIFKASEPLIPAPGGTTANWPAIAKPIVEIWQLAWDNLHEFVLKYSYEVKKYGVLILFVLTGYSKDILSIIVTK